MTETMVSILSDYITVIRLFFFIFVAFDRTLIKHAHHSHSGWIQNSGPEVLKRRIKVKFYDKLDFLDQNSNCHGNALEGQRDI